MESQTKTAAVLIVGNEILSGRTQDINVVWIARYLEKLGIVLTEVSIVPDIEQRIIDKVIFYSKNCDYVFTTGGIGPTHDDITTASVAKAFGIELERREDVVAQMQRHHGTGDLTEARLKMADIPKDAVLIDNPVSGAPGYQINNVFVLAGVPEIMRAMLDGVYSRLSDGPPFLTANVSTNLTESMLADGMSEIQGRNGNVSIGSYPYFRDGKQGVNIVLRSTDLEMLSTQFDAIIKLIRQRGGNILAQSMPDHPR